MRLLNCPICDAEFEVFVLGHSNSLGDCPNKHFSIGSNYVGCYHIVNEQWFNYKVWDSRSHEKIREQEKIVITEARQKFLNEKLDEYRKIPKRADY